MHKKAKAKKYVVLVQEICCLTGAEAYEHMYSNNSKEQPGHK